MVTAAAGVSGGLIVGQFEKERAMLSKLPDAVLAEQAYLVSRGVRALAIAGECENTEFEKLRAMTRLETAALQYGCISFVVPRGNKLAGERGFADCGYCRHAWAVDLLEWVNTSAPSDFVRDSILGLLCGYSSEGIAGFHDWRAVRSRVGLSYELDESASS